jgi:hypothetical protein
LKETAGRKIIWNDDDAFLEKGVGWGKNLKKEQMVGIIKS